MQAYGIRMVGDLSRACLIGTGERKQPGRRASQSGRRRELPKFELIHSSIFRGDSR